jgi:hypothetical protein
LHQKPNFRFHPFPVSLVAFFKIESDLLGCLVIGSVEYSPREKLGKMRVSVKELVDILELFLS